LDPNRHDTAVAWYRSAFRHRKMWTAALDNRLAVNDQQDEAA
jgi:hypothetical protein